MLLFIEFYIFNENIEEILTILSKNKENVNLFSTVFPKKLFPIVFSHALLTHVQRKGEAGDSGSVCIGHTRLFSQGHPSRGRFGPCRFVRLAEICEVAEELAIVRGLLPIEEGGGFRRV